MHACTKTKKQVRMNLGTHAYVYVRKPQMLQVYMSSTTAYMFGICVFPHTHKMRSRTSASPCRVICPSSAPSVLPMVSAFTAPFAYEQLVQHSTVVASFSMMCLACLPPQRIPEFNGLKGAVPPC